MASATGVLDTSKVLNPRLYMRYKYVTDESVREAWRTYRVTMDGCASPEQFEAAMDDPRITYKEGADRHSAEAFIIWRYLSEKDKEKWKNWFREWKAAQRAARAEDEGGSASVSSAAPIDVESILDSTPVPF